MRTRKGRGQKYIETLKKVNFLAQKCLIEVKISYLHFTVCLFPSNPGKVVFFFLNFQAPARTWHPLGWKPGFGI